LLVHGKKDHTFCFPPDSKGKGRRKGNSQMSVGLGEGQGRGFSLFRGGGRGGGKKKKSYRFMVHVPINRTKKHTKRGGTESRIRPRDEKEARFAHPN